MKKKLILSLAAVIAIAIGVVGFSAFEAHIINVTAHIENSMNVPTNPILFGTIFPEEVANHQFTMGLSTSFLAQDRLNDVEYVIRQKPKCIDNDGGPGEPIFFPANERPNAAGFFCDNDPDEDNDAVLMNVLCPFLSKEPITSANDPVANDGTLAAFHGPISNWAPADSVLYQVSGNLVKGTDPTDTWNIDLHAPCFKGQCAQDNVIPAAYQLDPSLEGQDFGCDLWIEGTGYSTEETGSITIIKHVVGDGPAGALDDDDVPAEGFTMHLKNSVPAEVGTSPDPGSETGTLYSGLSAGNYTVSEDPVTSTDENDSYTTVYSGACNGTPNIILAAGQNLTCTVTNTWQEED